MSSQGLLPTGESFSLTRNSDYLYNGRLRGSLAQSVEQRTFNPLVAGSNPARPTNRISYLAVVNINFYTGIYFM